MASRGQIQIDVVADTTKFAAQVEREIKAVLKGLKLRPVTVDADTKSFTDKIRKAQTDADKSFQALFARLKSQASKAGDGIGGVLVGGLVSAVASSIDPVVASVVSLVKGIGPGIASGIPAAVGALGTLSVAMFGVGDALNKLTDDQEKFDKELANLSPNAQSFIQQLREMALSLQQANPIQEKFFDGFDTALKQVAAELGGPVVAGMGRVVGQLNQLVKRTVDYITSARGQEAVISIFRATSQVIDEVGKLLGPLINKFFDLVAVATDAKRIDASFVSIKETLKSLGQAASNVTASIGLIFAGVAKDGPTAAAGIASATQAIKDFLASAEGQEAIANLRDTLDRLRGVAADLLPILGSLSTGGFGALLTAVEQLLGGIKPVSDALGGQKGLFETLGAAIVVATIAVKAYQAAVVAVTAAQIAWNAATTAGSAAMLTATVAINGTRLAVALLGTAFLAAGAQVTILTSAIFSTVAAMAAAAASALRTAAVVVASQIQQTAAMLATDAAWAALVIRAGAAQVATIAFAAAQRAVAIATNAWTAAQWLLNAAMTANPIGIVIAIIVALVAAIVYAYNNSETFRNIVDAAFRAVGDAAIWLWENAIKPLWEGIVAAFNFIVAAAKAWWAGVVAAFNAVVAAASALAAAVVGFFARLRDGAAAQLSALIGFVSSIPGRILSALGNVGSLLYSVGSSIVGGLRDGIAGAWHWVTSKVQSLINLIPAAIRDLLGISSPSKVTMALGAATGQGFAQGISAQMPAVRAATSSLVAPVMNAAPPAVNGAVRGGDGAGLVGTPGAGVRVWPSQPSRSVDLGTLRIDSAGAKLDDLMVQVLSKAVRVRGGNVQRVLGKTQAGVS